MFVYQMIELRFNEFGEYKHRYEVQETDLEYLDALEDPLSDNFDDVIDRCVYESYKTRLIKAFPLEARPQP